MRKNTFLIMIIILTIFSYLMPKMTYALDKNVFVVNEIDDVPVSIEEAGNAHIVYRTHVENIGWMNSVKDGTLSGTTGEAKRMEAIEINLESSLSGSVEYITYIENYAWETKYKKDGELSGTEGKALRLEAIGIKLTGEIANQYDIYYRVHAADYGWLEWAKNGETAGTIGLAKRLEAIEIKLVKKGTGENTGNSYKQKNDFLSYTSHVEDYGWLNRVTSGITGTTGKGKRIEAFEIGFEFAQYSGALQYKSYIEGQGWENSWKKNNQISGTTGKSKKIEQIKIQLTGDVSNYYDIYYRVHVEEFGWLGWAKNGEAAGTEKIGFRIESIEIKFVSKDEVIENTGNCLIKKEASITYSAHVRNIGDQQAVEEGETIGTTGKDLRMEALTIFLDSSLEGNILYQSYVDEKGWEEEYKKSGELTGTKGEGKGIQLLRMKLDGELGKKYDIYYRVHTDTFGWLSWAKNNEITGADCYDIQAVEIRLYLKEDGKKYLLDTSVIHKVTGFYQKNGYTYYKDKNGKQATDWITIMGKKYFFNSLGVMIGKDVKKVMDVSAWQGNIDWYTVQKEGDLDGVILRIAASSEYEDSKLERNITALKRLGIPYGIYIYSYAENKEEGEDYANFTIQLMKKYEMKPGIGIFFDLESNSITEHLTTQDYEEITRGFMDIMKNNGYQNLSTIYTYKNLAENVLNSDYLKNQITWIAQYNHFNTYQNDKVVGWQYSSQETVPGIKGTVDMSVWYTDF